MEKSFKFTLPSPNFGLKKDDRTKQKPHFLTPSGMTLLTREKQPPPMYGKRGATVPGRYLTPVAPTPVPIADPVKQYCEPCEMELGSLQDFKYHRSQHEKCPVDGCQYRGHPTVMDKHVQALHNSGLFDKFKKLSTPEEIAAWREERRKRYPTVANVLMKQKAQEQRQKRGERLEANKSRFGKHDDRKRAIPKSDTKNEVDLTPDVQQNLKNNEKKGRNKRRRKGKRDKKENNTNQTTASRVSAQESTCDDENQEVGIMFPGTLKMEGYKHFSREPDKPVNALSGLIGMYGSDDETDEEFLEKEDPDVKYSGTCNSNDDKTQLEGREEECKSIDSTTIQTTESCDTSNENDFFNKATTLEENKNNLANSKVNTILCQNNVFAESETGSQSESNKSRDNVNENHYPNLVPEASHVDEQNTKQDQVSCNLAVTESDLTLPQEKSSDEGPEEASIMRCIPEYKCEKEILIAPSSSVITAKDKSIPKTAEGSNRTKKVLKRKSGLDTRKAKVRKQNTMLEKLLEADIRHERNVLLQCVRYVCENKFFGVGASTAENNALQ